MGRKYKKNIKGGSDYGEGTEPPQTQGFQNDATNPQEDAANAGNADGDKLAELNNLQNGGKRKRRYQRGGNDHLKTEDVKAIEVDSPARETMAGPYTAQAQVTANQETGNQAMADTEYDNPGPAKGGGKRKTRKHRGGLLDVRHHAKKYGQRGKSFTSHGSIPRPMSKGGKKSKKSKKTKKKTVKKSRRKRSRKHH